jgi:hypothetical protein
VLWKLRRRHSLLNGETRAQLGQEEALPIALVDNPLAMVPLTRQGLEYE